MSDGSVSSIADNELLARAVRGARGRRVGPRWVAVSEAFCLGSTFAMQLCRRFNVDPNEKVKP